MSIYSLDGNIQIDQKESKAGQAKIEIINIVGQEVAAFTRDLGQGNHSYTLPFQATTGIYILRITQNGVTHVKKFVHQ